MGPFGPKLGPKIQKSKKNSLKIQEALIRSTKRRVLVISLPPAGPTEPTPGPTGPNGPWARSLGPCPNGPRGLVPMGHGLVPGPNGPGPGPCPNGPWPRGLVPMGHGLVPMGPGPGPGALCPMGPVPMCPYGSK